MNAILIDKQNDKIKHVKMVLGPDSSSTHPTDYYWVDDEGNIIIQVGDSSDKWKELSVDFKDREGLGIYMKQLRLLKKKSIRGLASECNLSPATIINIEAGKFTARMEIINGLLAHLAGSRLCITYPQTDGELNE